MVPKTHVMALSLVECLCLSVCVLVSDRFLKLPFLGLAEWNLALPLQAGMLEEVDSLDQIVWFVGSSVSRARALIFIFFHRTFQIPIPHPNKNMRSGIRNREPA